MSSNTPFSVYDPNLGKLVTTWHDVNIPSNNYSSLFDGMNWTTPILLSNTGISQGNVIPTVYDPALGKVVATWGDGGMPPTGFSSVFDGTTNSWSSPQMIPLIPTTSNLIIVFP